MTEHSEEQIPEDIQKIADNLLLMRLIDDNKRYLDRIDELEARLDETKTTIPEISEKNKRLAGAKMDNPIQKFCEDIITGSGGLHDFERCELASPVCDRDVATAIWVIKCLANPANEGSQEVIDAIIERRAKVLSS